VGRISLGAPGGWTWDRDVGLESRSVSRCWINGDPLWFASITIKAPLTQNNQTNQLPNIKAPIHSSYIFTSALIYKSGAFKLSHHVSSEN